MKKQIELNEIDIIEMLKKHLNIKGKPIFYLQGGIINSPSIRVVYFE